MPGAIQVREIMSTDLVTLTEDETLAHAQGCMARGRIRHLPVVRDGRLVGLVTHRDLIAASLSVFAEVSRSEQRRIFSRIPVRELMHDAVTVGQDTPVRDAARILIESKFGCLPVVDQHGALLGIVTEADFLRLTVRMLDAIQG